MSELEDALNKLLRDHQHESGLNVIGGRHQLVARLVRFVETREQQHGTEAAQQYGERRAS
jgi:hypothetical protein